MLKKADQESLSRPAFLLQILQNPLPAPDPPT